MQKGYRSAQALLVLLYTAGLFIALEHLINYGLFDGLICHGAYGLTLMIISSLSLSTIGGK